jgi:hypothetical protein
VAVWLRTVTGERYRLHQRSTETDDQVMRALMDGTVHGWAPVFGAAGGWQLINLAHVVRIETGPETGPEEDIRDSFR